MIRPVKTRYSTTVKESTLSEDVCLSWPDTPSEGKERLGDIMAFAGYAIGRSSVQTPDILHVTLWWQASDNKMERDYTAFIHVVGPDDRVWAQQDRLLRHAEDPTSTWLPGETVKDEYVLHLPPDTPPGEYTVKTGIHYWETGERLPV